MSTGGEAENPGDRSPRVGRAILGIAGILAVGGIAVALMRPSPSEGEQATAKCVEQLTSMVNIDPNIEMSEWSAREPHSVVPIGPDGTTPEPTDDDHTWGAGGTFDARYADGSSGVFDWVCSIDFRDGALQIAYVFYYDPART